MDAEPKPLPLTIVSLRSQNVKRLKAVRIEPRSTGLVVISGRNGQGKSSVIDSIAMAIGGKKLCPSEPIRRGEAYAEAEVDLGEFKVRRSFLPGGKTEVSVTAKDGNRYASPQSMLDGLVSHLSFDPLAFSRMDSKTQGNELRKLVGLDFADLDRTRSETYDRRTAVNREVTQLRGRLATMPALVANVPEDPVDITALAREMSEVQRTNTTNANHRSYAKQLGTQTEAAADRVRDLRQALDKAVIEHDRLQTLHREAAKHAATMQDVDTSPILNAISAAEQTNTKVRERHQRQQLAAEIGERERVADSMTEAIKLVDDEKLRRTAAAAMPVPGLGFTAEGEVTLDGLPLQQASAAQQLRVSVAIGIAGNPRLRVLLVRDGSLLDNDSMLLLAELAEASGTQVWVETVEKRLQTSVIIEDGEVRDEVQQP